MADMVWGLAMFAFWFGLVVLAAQWAWERGRRVWAEERVRRLRDQLADKGVRADW